MSGSVLRSFRPQRSLPDACDKSAQSAHPKRVQPMHENECTPSQRFWTPPPRVERRGARTSSIQPTPAWTAGTQGKSREAKLGTPHYGEANAREAVEARKDRREPVTLMRLLPSSLTQPSSATAFTHCAQTRRWRHKPAIRRERSVTWTLMACSVYCRLCPSVCARPLLCNFFHDRVNLTTF